jgi:hypothetical protein
MPETLGVSRSVAHDSKTIGLSIAGCSATGLDLKSRALLELSASAAHPHVSRLAPCSPTVPPHEHLLQTDNQEHPGYKKADAEAGLREDPIVSHLPFRLDSRRHSGHCERATRSYYDNMAKLPIHKTLFANR